MTLREKLSLFLAIVVALPFVLLMYAVSTASACAAGA
jgi:hypothetical protein